MPNLRLPHSDRAPRIARAFVAENLQSWQLHDLIEPATLVVSEVVTNAVIHARSDAELVLERTPTALRISVTVAGADWRGARIKRLRRRPRPSDRATALDELGSGAHGRRQSRVGRALD